MSFVCTFTSQIKLIYQLGTWVKISKQVNTACTQKKNAIFFAKHNFAPHARVAKKSIAGGPAHICSKTSRRPPQRHGQCDKAEKVSLCKFLSFFESCEKKVCKQMASADRQQATVGLNKNSCCGLEGCAPNFFSPCRQTIPQLYFFNKKLILFYL
jgi:hypothetical protein